MLAPPPPTDRPREVSRFEARLLRVARAVVAGPAEVERAMPLIFERQSRPNCLSRAAVELVCDTLAKGCVRRLAEAGGWRRERFGDARDGRLWERADPASVGLVFSTASLDLLLWLTAYKPGETRPLGEIHPNTPADLFLVALVYDGLRATEAGQHLRPRPLFARNPLCRLLFVEEFVAYPNETPDYEPLTKGVGAAILEAVQPVLRQAWLELEARKGLVGDWAALDVLGAAQETTLTGFADALERADRRDLARFLLQTLAAWVTPRLALDRTFGGLASDGPIRLAERVAVQRRALALLRFTDRLAAWTRRAEAVGYLDEGYAKSQLWKADAERYRLAAVRQRARELLAEIDPLNVDRPEGE